MDNPRIDNAQDAIAKLREELRQLLGLAQREGDIDTARERLKRWKERAVRVVAEQIHPREAEKLSAKRKGSFIAGYPLRNLADEAHMYDSFLGALSEEITRHPDQILDVPVARLTAPPTVQAPQPGGSNVVFIIHGRDELNLFRLKEMLKERWHLEPIVLAGEPGKGRTIIEKFENEAQRAVFALALLTPDDVVSMEDKKYAQPRPNVIFELGWFYGRLGRERVCILFKEGTRIHTDLEGISRIEFRESVDEKVGEIERELAGVGILST